MSFSKVADAMARAYARGEIKLNSTDEKIAFSDKLKTLEPRKSGNMGMMSKSPFDYGAEGKVYYGSMRGKSLGVRKVFGEGNYFEGQLDTSTVRRRARLMKSMPDVYPEVYRYDDKARTIRHPNRGFIDMEHIPLKKMKTSDDMFKAYSDVYDVHTAHGFEHISGYGSGFYNKQKDLLVRDLHPGNVGLNARTGKGVVLDPLVYKPLHDRANMEYAANSTSETKKYIHDAKKRSLEESSINKSPKELLKADEPGIFRPVKAMAVNEEANRVIRAEHIKRVRAKEALHNRVIPVPRGRRSDSTTSFNRKLKDGDVIEAFNNRRASDAFAGKMPMSTPSSIKDIMARNNIKTPKRPKWEVSHVGLLSSDSTNTLINKVNVNNRIDLLNDARRVNFAREGTGGKIPTVMNEALKRMKGIVKARLHR